MKFRKTHLAVGTAIAVGALLFWASRRIVPDVTVQFSQRKAYIIGTDSSGNFVKNQFAGNWVALEATVAEVRLRIVPPSESVREEVDEVDFVIRPKNAAQENPKWRVVRMKFCRYDGLIQKPFKKGDNWTIELTSHGELVDIFPDADNGTAANIK